jgi:hypothetical protein
MENVEHLGNVAVIHKLPTGRPSNWRPRCLVLFVELKEQRLVFAGNLGHRQRVALKHILVVSKDLARNGLPCLNDPIGLCALLRIELQVLVKGRGLPQGQPRVLERRIVAAQTTDGIVGGGPQFVSRVRLFKGENDDALVHRTPGGARKGPLVPGQYLGCRLARTTMERKDRSGRPHRRGTNESVAIDNGAMDQNHPWSGHRRDDPIVRVLKNVGNRMAR